jgi:uncharacterized protein
MDLEAKAAALERELGGLRGLLVAYSGGTDSAFLAWAAWRALGDGMLAVIADSASLPRAELAAALEFTARHGIPTRILQTEELANPAYQRNDARRCFHCKDELFGQMEAFRAAEGFAHIAYGRNVDDDGEFRPGQEAAAEHGALAPLVTAGLGKAEVRELARRAGLELWDKPASACLASRIEYGRAVTRENLAQVEQAEAALHAMGFQQVRVRHHGEVARVEIARDDLARALDLTVMAEMTAAVKAAGFRYAALDMQGYRTGSMNEVLLVSAIAPAAR